MFYQSVQDPEQKQQLEKCQGKTWRFTNFRTCARVAGICRSFSQDLKSWQDNFPALLQPHWPDACQNRYWYVPSTLPATACSIPTLPCGLSNPTTLAGAPLTWLPLPHLAGIPSKDRHPHRPTITLPYPVSSPGWDKCHPKVILSPKRGKTSPSRHHTHNF